MSSVYIGLNNFFAGLILRPQFISSGFYSIPFYINPGHYVYESMVTAIFHRDQRLVLANVGSEFYDFLVDNNINGCTVGNLRCIGTVAQYVDVFFGFQFSHENMARNALILGGVLTFTRVMTWVALKYIRFDAS